MIPLAHKLQSIKLYDFYHLQQDATTRHILPSPSLSIFWRDYSLHNSLVYSSITILPFSPPPLLTAVPIERVGDMTTSLSPRFFPPSKRSFPMNQVCTCTSSSSVYCTQCSVSRRENKTSPVTALQNTSEMSACLACVIHGNCKYKSLSLQAVKLTCSFLNHLSINLSENHEYKAQPNHCQNIFTCPTNIKVILSLTNHPYTFLFVPAFHMALPDCLLHCNGISVIAAILIVGVLHAMKPWSKDSTNFIICCK